MKLARKLQIAYLALMLTPMIIVGTVFMASYYTGHSTVGPNADVEAPGWIKSELALILDSDWPAYLNLSEKIVIFVMDADSRIIFPDFSGSGFNPENYPFSMPGSETDPAMSLGPLQMSDVFRRFGTDWTLDLTFSPAVVDDKKYLVGWVPPQHGIPGFFAGRAWIFPLFFLCGVLFIPAIIDAKLRGSIRRLQEATARLASGELDEPIVVTRRDDLRDLAATLEATRMELKDARERRSRFLMAVSHDLRTPLTSIKGYVEALNDGLADTPEEQERYLSVLDEKTRLLEGRIDELIDFARSDTGGWQGGTTELDARELFSNLGAVFARDCGFAGREYREEVALEGSIVLSGDYRTLYRAWENLFANALRYTQEGDTIIFRTGLTGAGMLYGEIADSGTGVPPEFVSRLFEPFTRADRGRNTRGLGLGLASVKSVVESHDGTVSYRPAEGRGSVFRIEIPLAEG